MKSPRERYLNDVKFKMLVDMLEHYIHTCDFTPSELREAAILASINYESYRIRKYVIQLTPEIHDQLEKFHLMVDGSIEK